jgi:hypothetical protein
MAQGSWMNDGTPAALSEGARTTTRRRRKFKRQIPDGLAYGRTNRLEYVPLDEREPRAVPGDVGFPRISLPSMRGSAEVRSNQELGLHFLPAASEQIPAATRG